VASNGIISVSPPPFSVGKHHSGTVVDVHVTDQLEGGRATTGPDDGFKGAETTRVAGASVPGSGAPVRPEGGPMSDHVYRLSEIVGSSPASVDEAIRTAIAKAAQTVRNIEWFQTEEIRGQVVDGAVAYFQVRLKIGFRVED
jgi:flavin-binding protein dodecin